MAEQNEEQTQARDGFDNTGTQGYDSLQDAGYTGSRENNEGPETGTGSSSESFHEVPSEKKDDLSDEDKALDSGI